MYISQVTTELGEYLAALGATEERLKAELATNQEMMRAVEAVLEGYPMWRESLPSDEAATESPITGQDLKDCSSQMAALGMIAERNQGYVKGRVAAKLLMEAALTKSTDINSVGATVQKLVTGHPDWQYHEPGTFLYLPYFKRQPDYEPY